jgi:tetratricopeptide (TPR) repeat protein
MGRFDDAIKVLVVTQEAHHLWPILPATEVLLRLCQRQFEAAVALGKQAVELHPFFLLSRLFYAQALECSGDIEAALEQYRLSTVMFSGPMILALEGRCLAKLRRLEESRKILCGLQQVRNAAYVDAYHMALLLDALGRRDEAFQELNRAVDENSATLCFLDVDPKLDPLRGDPRFPRVRHRVFGAPTPARQPRIAANGLRIATRPMA